MGGLARTPRTDDLQEHTTNYKVLHLPGLHRKNLDVKELRHPFLERC